MFQEACISVGKFWKNWLLNNKMMKAKLYIASILLGLVSLSCERTDSGINDVDYVSFVEPLIGSGGHGHVFVGASVPHGMIQLGPNNQTKGWDWCSGYHDSDSTIIGFAHTHLSGTGIADLGDIILMPAVNVKDSAGCLPFSSYVSTFNKEKEVVVPGYYSVFLNRSEIKAELTATDRVGFHKYSYPANSEAQVIVDLENGAQSLMLRKGTLDSYCKIVNDSTVIGYRKSDEWATDHKVFFKSVFSKPILSYEEFKEGNGVKMLLNFGNIDSQLLVRTAISYASEEGASANLDAEGCRDFEKVRAEAKHLWNDALGRIHFEAGEESMKIFYTALYHTMISPSLFLDADNNYRGADGKIHTAGNFVPYTVFSLWDTYRAVHPLYTLIDEKNADYVNSLLAITEEQGELPVWHLVGNETQCMVGVHSIPIIVDACLKNISGIDKEKAYQLVRSFYDRNDNGLDYLRNEGYLPADKVTWSVARALEYAVDDYCIAMLAKELGKNDDYELFMKRSEAYRCYFDPSVGFMRGKLSDGTWREPFDPYHSLHMEDDYVEGNAWQYTWLVPHDVNGLVDLFGGKEKFMNKLDSLFTVSSELNEGASIDITGMIGQYAHGNEPSHHILYLYSCIGEADRTAELVRRVYDEFYSTDYNGLIGNEDCGQMSAWYIFSSLGFYPVNPVDGKFVFGSPLADKAVLKLNNGKTFTVIAHNNSHENKYIKSVLLNGEKYDKGYIEYDDIMKGGKLEFEMYNKNN